MITPSTIYWISRLAPICFISFAMALIGSMLAIMIWLGYAIAETSGDEEFASRLRKYFKPFAITAVIGIMTQLFVPTTKEAAAMLVIPKIANSESVQQLGDGIVDLANQWLKELAPNKEEKK